MADTRARRRLDQPRSARRFSVDLDPETFGRLSEKLARFMGTGTFLFWQTLLVIIWISLNVVGVGFGWDPYPFILLNLAFSTQAAYAAPLILLAQNRQDDRDRITLDEDRNRSAQTKADTEFLARELAALRVAIGEVATRDYLRGELDRLRDDLDDMANPDSADKTVKRTADKNKNRAKSGRKPPPPAAKQDLKQEAKPEPKQEPKPSSKAAKDVAAQDPSDASADAPGTPSDDPSDAPVIEPTAATDLEH